MEVAKFLALLVEGFDFDLMEGFHLNFVDQAQDLVVDYSHFLIINHYKEIKENGRCHGFVAHL